MVVPVLAVSRVHAIVASGNGFVIVAIKSCSDRSGIFVERFALTKNIASKSRD